MSVSSAKPPGSGPNQVELDNNLRAGLSRVRDRFGPTLAEAAASLDRVSPSSPEGKQQLEAIKALARLELFGLNNTLLRAMGGSPSPAMPIMDLGSGLAGWLKILNLSRPRAEAPQALIEAGPTPVGPSETRPAGRNFDDLIEKTARDHGLDPNLVRAVVKAESNFDPRAVSKAGAMGLMQLMPGTAKDMGVSDPFDPFQNLYGGTRYLREMLDRYSGDINQALAAYNWGPGNLDRSTGFLPDETRSYIRNVSRFYGDFSAGNKS